MGLANGNVVAGLRQLQSPYFLERTGCGWHHTRVTKVCFSFALICLLAVLPAQAFDWQTATARGRDYVTLFSFCQFYGFGYASPAGNSVFDSRNPQGHTVRMKLGSPDLFLDGVHYVMSFPVESGDRDWLVSRMDVIKLFEPVLRPTEISGRHAIRGVVIDAGHGGTDNGAQSRLGAEKNYTIDTAFRLEEILRNAGLKTVLTRRNDVFVDLYERAHIASLYPDYAFVSIHYNSAEPEARGLETYCLAPRGAASTSSSYLTRSDIQMLPGNDDDAQNILLAAMVHSEIIKLNPGDTSMDRGVKRARFVVIKQNTLPAILVEGGFVSNRMESARVNSPDYRQRLAQAIARGLIRFVNVMGDKRMSLPGGGSSDNPSVPPPRAQAVVLPVTPPAPSGLARDLGKKKPTGAPSGKAMAGAVPASTAPQGPAIHTSMPVANSGKTALHKKKKGKKTQTDSAPAGTPPEATAAPSVISPAHSATVSSPTPEKSTGAPLNLAEPATPAPTVAEKPGAEPDEPPTVNNCSKEESSKSEAAPNSSTNSSDAGASHP
jgi:N-acetylmuramoyl-L-alanine amidase